MIDDHEDILERSNLSFQDNYDLGLGGSALKPQEENSLTPAQMQVGGRNSRNDSEEHIINPVKAIRQQQRELASINYNDDLAVMRQPE